MLKAISSPGVRRIFLLAVWFSCAVCAREDRPGAESDPLDEFFSMRVHEIEISVGSNGVASLLVEPRTYVRGAVTVDGAEYEGVGVRLKGGAGSFVALDGDYPEISRDGNGNPGKSAFIVDFNRYTPGQTHLGLKKLTLNNLVQDPSCMHEFLAYGLFRAAGVPASRSGWANITFNGAAKGLYAPIETPDNDELLEKWYGNDRGNLYEGEYGTGLTVERVQDFDQDHGSDTSKQDLRTLAEALDRIGPTDDVVTELEALIDLDSYLDFAATELYLGHWDGYAFSRNNYIIHHDTVNGVWNWMPWGIDQTFVDKLEPYAGVMSGPGLQWHDHGGRIHQICMGDSGCRVRLHYAFVDLLERVEEIDLAALARQARELVVEIALAEAVAHGDPALTHGHVDGVSEHIESSRDRVARWLPCLLGEPVDNDHDGYDGCAEDCDDRNPERHPGSEEVCNLVDDDCNGVVDDPVECPPCVEREGPGSVQYTVCFRPMPWSEARAHCQSIGQELVSIHDEETAEHVFFAGVDVFGWRPFWIGLNDRDTEGTFVWTDGSGFDYARWGESAPQSAPEGNEMDCVQFSELHWRDVPCAEPLRFVCAPGT